jgi:transcriptional regulator with XRE-family HTH domain
MRKKTKHRKNPVQQVRLICDLSQAEFAARVGYKEDYIKKVECGINRLSVELTNRIFLFCGAMIEPGHPPFGIGPNDTLVPFTLEVYKNYLNQAERNQAEAGRDRLFGTTEDMVNTLKFSIEVWLEQAQNARYAHTGLADAKLYGMIEELIGHLGLAEQLKERIEGLAKSPIAKAKGIARCLCQLTGSFALMNAWLSRPQDNKKEPNTAGTELYSCTILTSKAARAVFSSRTL